MNKIIILVLTLAYALTQVTQAQAGGPILTQTHTVTGSKVNTHLPQAKHHTPAQCEVIDWRPELVHYLDGDTPTEIAYQDYLSDLAWFYDAYPVACKVVIEQLPIE